MYEKFEFPLEVQRWIVRKRLVSDKETISSTRVKSEDELYLYLVPARTVGVTKKSARASYLGISRQCLFTFCTVFLFGYSFRLIYLLLMINQIIIYLLINFKGQRCQLVTFCHPGLTYILISDIRALWRSALSARVPECRKFKM